MKRGLQNKSSITSFTSFLPAHVRASEWQEQNTSTAVFSETALYFKAGLENTICIAHKVQALNGPKIKSKR